MALLLYSFIFTLTLGASGLQLTQHYSNVNLTRVAVYKDTGQVIVGGVNILVSLDEDLKNVVNNHLGPHFDSDKCFKEPAPCTESKTFEANTVTVLEINPVHKYVLVCGSIWQGLCSIYMLSDINSEISFNSTSHATFIGSKASSVAFFGLQKDTTLDSVRLYAAVATYDKTNDMFSPYTISTRVVINNDREHNIEYLKEGISQFDNSFLTVSPATRKDFKVHYIYGFELDGYGYYVAVQPIDRDIARTKYATKLIQFCQEDDYYWTYIEVPLACHRNGIDYTLATAAHIGSDGMQDYLAVSFGRHGNRPSREPDKRYGSVVCNFSMETAKEMLSQIRKRCSNGGTGSYPWWIYGNDRSCHISDRIVSLK